MQTKSSIWIGAAIGSTLGGFLPSLWGAGTFSVSGIIFSGLGAILGIWFMFKATR